MRDVVKVANGIEQGLRDGPDQAPTAVDEPAEINGFLELKMQGRQGIVLLGADEQAVTT